jgi:hypothetical protein
MEREGREGQPSALSPPVSRSSAISAHLCRSQREARDDTEFLCNISTKNVKIQNRTDT